MLTLKFWLFEFLTAFEMLNVLNFVTLVQNIYFYKGFCGTEKNKTKKQQPYSTKQCLSLVIF